jgi:hypothetical protein
MKKYIHILTAITILASCAKSEVNYEPSGQVTLAPVKGNVTKAAGMTGALPQTQELIIWSEWTHDGKTESYINGDPFAYNRTYQAWAGKTGSYPWPLHGTLSFSGYTIPTASCYPGYQSPNTDNVLFTFTDYTNDEFDLCWFGRVNGVNNRLSGDEVEVDLYHALSWITIQAYGEGTPVGRWQITSLTLEDATVTGDAICYYDGVNKNKAIWTADATGDVTLPIIQAQGTHTITDTATKLTDNIIIPQTPTDLTIGYSYQVGDQTKTDSRTVSLKLNEGNTTKWASGVHYTYTLVFKSNEILVAPSFGAWGTENQNITVE